MRRLTLALALSGLLSGLPPAREAEAAGGRRGQTYHYNGGAGYWTPSGYANPCCYARPSLPPQYQYATQPTAYAPRPAYPAPALYPTYGQPRSAGIQAPPRR